MKAKARNNDERKRGRNREEGGRKGEKDLDTIAMGNK